MVLLLAVAVMCCPAELSTELCYERMPCLQTNDGLMMAMQAVGTTKLVAEGAGGSLLT